MNPPLNPTVIHQILFSFHLKVALLSNLSLHRHINKTRVLWQFDTINSVSFQHLSQLCDDASRTITFERTLAPRPTPRDNPAQISTGRKLAHSQRASIGHRMSGQFWGLVFLDGSQDIHVIHTRKQQMKILANKHSKEQERNEMRGSESCYSQH